MKVKMLRFTVAAGKDRAPGEKVDVTEKEARLLIGLGKAEEVKRGRPPKTDTVQTDLSAAGDGGGG